MKKVLPLQIVALNCLINVSVFELGDDFLQQVSSLLQLVVWQTLVLLLAALEVHDSGPAGGADLVQRLFFLTCLRLLHPCHRDGLPWLTAFGQAAL